MGHYDAVRGFGGRSWGNRNCQLSGALGAGRAAGAGTVTGRIRAR